MKITILNDYKNIREYLSTFLQVSKKNIHTLNMSKEGVTLNGESTTLYKEVKAGDVLEITEVLATSNYRMNTAKEIKKEYEDDYILIVSKPFDMKTHPNDVFEEDDTLVNYLIAEHDYLEPIHRLDIDTCGLVIFAKTPLVKAKLDASLEKREIKRYYSAIVRNNLKPQKITTKIGRDLQEKNKMAVTKTGKEAITNILACEQVADGFYKVLISLETGRTHQIRVHLAHLGSNIIGDRLYSRDFYKFENMYLGALKVELTHPVTNEKLVVSSSLASLFDEFGEE